MPRNNVELLSKAVATDERMLSSSVIHVSDEFCWFGVRIVEITATEICDRIIATCFPFKRLSDKPVLSQFIPQSSGYMLPRRSCLTMLAPQIECYRLWRHSNLRPIK